MIPKQILDDARIDMQDVADIAAMTGVSYFKGAFRKKGFDGTPWPLAKKDKAGTRRRGSLMIDSAALMNSIRIARATPQEVVWTAGNAKVPYAEVHNTGGRAGRGRGFQMPGVSTWATPRSCGRRSSHVSRHTCRAGSNEEGGLAAPFFRRIISSPDGWTRAAVWRFAPPARRAGCRRSGRGPCNIRPHGPRRSS